MLDLTKLNSPLYEIKWLDGTVLKLGKPSQKLLNKIIKTKDVDENDEAVIDIIYDLLVEVLNLNRQGKTYTIDDVRELDIQLVTLIFEDYFEFLGKELGE